MIDENFLQSAIRIRRNFLKLNNNVNVYKKQANNVIKYLEDCVKKVENIDIKKDYSENAQIIELINLMNELSAESEKIEEFINPLNKEIEQLAIEERQLYERIKEKHFDLTDEQIIESIRERLIRENIS